MTANFHIPLAADRRAVAVDLQGALVDLLDLTLIGKHLHWNVEGPHFRSLHQELDEQVDAWRELSDDVAERAVTIGASPDGQAETIAGATQLEPLPGGRLSDQQVLRAIGDRVAAAARRARDRIDRVDDIDPVTVTCSSTSRRRWRISWDDPRPVRGVRAGSRRPGRDPIEETNGGGGS